jgi:hypothetical protein
MVNPRRKMPSAPRMPKRSSDDMFKMIYDDVETCPECDGDGCEECDWEGTRDSYEMRMDAYEDACEHRYESWKNGDYDD